MKVLVATTAGAGHFAGVLPFARACMRLGHDVRVAAPESFAPTVRNAGFVHEPLGDVSPGVLGPIFGGLAELSRTDANAVVISEVFGRLNTRAALPAMRALCDRWRPDVVLREPAELSSYVAAQQFGIPHIQTNIGLSRFDDFVLPLFAGPLGEMDCDTAALSAAPRWSVLPPSFDDPSRLAAGPVSYARDDSEVATPPPLPNWWPAGSDPLVYVTFGSVAASMGLFPTFYGRVLEQLSEAPVRVLLTLGEAGEPAALDPVPPNVHIERWWPQHAVMPHAAAVVGHGGFGTTHSALVAGVPQVAIPLFSHDQFANAARLQEIGIGVALTDAEADSRPGGVLPNGPDAVERLAPALLRLLDDGQARERAGVLADEIVALPSAAECVEAGTAAL